MDHPGKRGIRLLMGSPPGDWSKIKNTANLAPYEAEREQWYANVVKTEVLAKHHRALLIMGAGHFLRGHNQALRLELAMQQHRWEDRRWLEAWRDPSQSCRAPATSQATRWLIR